MKIFILFLLILNTLVAKRIEINLYPSKDTLYSENQNIGSIVFNMFPNKNVYIIANNISKLKNPLYVLNKEKAFWLLTDRFIEVLKRYKFYNKDYIYFAFYDSNKKTINENMYLRINISNLKKYNNRDFLDNDKEKITNKTIKKYELIPIRDLFKNSSITTNRNGNLVVSNILTREYHHFIDEYTFSSIGYFEFNIENNYKEILDIKNNIHSYCLNGNYDKVQFYINLGFDVNIKDSDNHQTLLEYATVNNHYNIVKLLIDNGADPNVHRKNYENAYLSAKRQGFNKIAKLLKPITKMTERPILSSSNFYNASDLKNMCLGSSGRYKNNCYNIKNKDLKNACLGMIKYPNFAYNIQNNDLKNFTLGASKQYKNNCYNIKNKDLKNACIGISTTSSNCYNIKDANLKNMCIGISTNYNNCYNIR